MRNRSRSPAMRGRGFGGAAWLPSSIAGHLATVTGDTLVGDHAAVVQTWPGLDAATVFSQATLAKRGSVLVSSGKRALRLDAVDDGYTGPTLTAGAQTLAVCCSVRSLAASGTRVLNGDFTNNLVQPRRTLSVHVAAAVVSSALVADDSASVVIITKEAGGNWAVYLNGVSQAVTARIAEWSAVNLAAVDFYPEPCDCDIWGISLLNSQVTGGNVALLNAYLRGFAPS